MIRPTPTHVLTIAAVLGTCLFGAAVAQAVHAIGRGAKPQLSSTAKFVIRRTSVAPGDRGRGTATVTNRSAKAATKITMTQKRPSGANLGRYLQLSVHDDTTNRCYWPRPAKGRCRGLGRWQTKLRATPIRSRTGKATWARGERHRFTMTWSLSPNAPNDVQRRTSAFVITWKAS